MEATYHEIDAIVENAKSTMFDVVICSDISPSSSEILDKHKNIILLDHHESALHLHNPEKFRYVYDNECGAAVTKRFIETVFGVDLSYLDGIVYLANDYDLWIHDDPKSKEYANLYYHYWNEKFVRRFFNGDTEWTEDEKEFIRQRNHDFEQEWNATESFEFESINGCVCYGKKYINDIADRFINDEGYDVVIFRNVNNKNVSVRSKGDIDIGGLVTELGFGGGHKNAGGISEKDIDKLMEKLRILEKELYNRYKEIRL